MTSSAFRWFRRFRSLGTLPLVSPALGCPVTASDAVNIATQDGVDTRLVVISLGAEELHKVPIKTQCDLLLRLACGRRVACPEVIWQFPNVTIIDRDGLKSFGLYW
jgi:hypothetical protein